MKFLVNSTTNSRSSRSNLSNSLQRASKASLIDSFEKDQLFFRNTCNKLMKASKSKLLPGIQFFFSPAFCKADEFSTSGGGGNRTRVRKGSQTPSTIISCVCLFKTFVTHRRVSTHPIRLEILGLLPQWPGVKPSRFCRRFSQCLPAESAGEPSQRN